MVGGKPHWLLSHTIIWGQSLSYRSLAERGTLEILFEMCNRFHSNERGGEGEGLCERYGASRIAVEPRESGANLIRERSCELRLHESGASNYSNVDAVRCLQQRDAVNAHTLSRNTHRFGHGEVDRELDDLEMVVLASYIARDAYELLEAQVVSSFGRYPEPIPGRAAVTTNDPTLDLFLQN